MQKRGLGIINAQPPRCTGSSAPVLKVPQVKPDTRQAYDYSSNMETTDQETSASSPATPVVPRNLHRFAPPFSFYPSHNSTMPRPFCFRR